jgi:hypothetical protein
MLMGGMIGGVMCKNERILGEERGKESKSRRVEIQGIEEESWE